MTPALTALHDARFFVAQRARAVLAHYRATQSSRPDSLQHAEAVADLDYDMEKLAAALEAEQLAVAALEGRSAPEVSHA